METDVLIIGGGTGAVAAALSCSLAGVRWIIVEPTSMIGGQFTSQAVPPDENEWIEPIPGQPHGIGGTRLYATLRERVRASYRERGVCAPNPGGGWVSRLCAEPRDWHACMLRMLHEATNDATLTSSKARVILGATPISADVDADHVRAVRFRTADDEELVTRARLFLDASELGDLLHLAKIEHAIGAEHQSVHGELHARTDFPAAQRYDTRDQQAISWCFALEHRPGENHVITKPARYDWWRSYIPGGPLDPIGMSPGWTGPLFSWTVPSHSADGRRTFRLVPPPDQPQPAEWEMWRYRRIVDHDAWPATAPKPPDVSLINMVQMDCWQKPLLGVTDAEQRDALRLAREQSLCFLYWMQTDAPRHDPRGPGFLDQHGYPGLKLRGDELASPDGFALAPYIRESRRLIARTIVHEGHIGTEQRRAGTTPAVTSTRDPITRFGLAEPFPDSVGIGHYMIDLHPSCAERNNVYVPCAPFRIPMGALIPVRVRNVLAAGKCLGVSHVANGAYRMHHVEWNIGESAGALAAWCIKHACEPHQIHENAERVKAFQDRLTSQGVRVSWPWE
jgi:hypothetical protein